MPLSNSPKGPRVGADSPLSGTEAPGVLERAESITVDSRRLLGSLFAYETVMDAEDERILNEWVQEIRSMNEETKAFLREHQDTCRIIALGEHPTETDITLYNIARFILKKRKNKTEEKFIIRAVGKFMKGGRHNIRELLPNETFSTCLDTSIVAKLLADRFGIEGEIAKPGRLPHFYWKQRGDKEAIIDAYWLHNMYEGYLNRPELYKKVARTKYDPHAAEQ